jgi:hypothetical protein
MNTAPESGSLISTSRVHARYDGRWTDKSDCDWRGGRWLSHDVSASLCSASGHFTMHTTVQCPFLKWDTLVISRIY